MRPSARGAVIEAGFTQGAAVARTSIARGERPPYAWAAEVTQAPATRTFAWRELWRVLIATGSYYIAQCAMQPAKPAGSKGARVIRSPRTAQTAPRKTQENGTDESRNHHCA
jgi:hypothetical protein